MKINRAPVLTLWAAVVAERLGQDPETALTLGRAVAGLNAQSKGKRLGIYKEPEEKPEKKASESRKPARTTSIELLGRAVPAIRTREGWRATVTGEAIDPQSVRRYLSQKFGQALEAVRAAPEALAKAFPPE